MRILITSIIFVFLSNIGNAQTNTEVPKDPKPAAKKKQTEQKISYLSREGINRLANNKFGGLVTGQTNSTNLINYASFSPAAGSFTFNGSIPIGKDNDESQFSFLSFKITGDLISDSYAALFQNAKLNTGVTISSQWDFRLKKGFKINYLLSDKFNVDMKRKLLDFQKAENNNQLGSQKTLNPDKLALLKIHLTLNEANLKKEKETLASLETELNDLVANHPEKTKEIQDLYESVLKQKGKIEEIEKDDVMSKWKRDSLSYIILNPEDFTTAMQNKMDNEYKTKKRLLEDSATITGIRFHWFSILAGAGKKNYYFFNPLEPFSTQMHKDHLNTWRVGLMWNYYSERSFPKRIVLINVGVFRYEDNNTALLSTQDIAQEKVIKNTLGDTTRKISKTYKAYTDSIIGSKVVNFISNFYLLYSSKKSGIHLFPSIDIYDHAKTLLNVGIGYLISFKNTEKEKTIINAEGYIQFQDLSNELDKEKGFFRRNEMGVRFTLPFNFF